MSDGNDNTASASEEVPKSPWAERFVQADVGSFVNQNPSRSGYAPEFPTLHPKYSADVPAEFNQPTTDKEIDRLYYSERIQQKLCWTEIRRLAPLHTQLSGGDDPMPGGHRREDDLPDVKEALKKRFEQETIDVDEDNWFSFFRKERWYGTHIDGELFSVDNEKTWEILRVCLELSNRIIRQLITQKDRHMATCLYGLICLWDDFTVFKKPLGRKARVVLSYEQEMAFRRKGWSPFNDSGPSRDPWTDGSDASCFHLETILRETIFSFTHDGVEPAWAVTQPIMRKQIILLNVTHLKILMDGDSTYAERSSCIFSVAVTICHELMHAIFYSRYSELYRMTYSAKPTQEEVDEGGIDEPFVDFEPICELGESWENAVFGDRLTMEPGPQAALPKLAVRPLTMASFRWPNSRFSLKDHIGMTTGIYRSWAEWKDMTYGTGYNFIPAAFTYKLLTKKFWEEKPTEIKDFRIPDVIVGESGITLDTNPHVNEDSSSLASYRYIADAWKERDRLWATRRSEATRVTHFKTWDASPWAQIGPRAMLDGFSKAFLNRDETKCRSIADNLINRVPYHRTDRNLPSLTRGTASSMSAWIYHVIGAYMQAALPFRTKDIAATVHNSQGTHYPSRAAAATGKEKLRAHNDAEERGGQRKSRLLDVRSGHWVNIGRQRDFVQYAVELMVYIEKKQVRMSESWLKELRSTSIKLWKARGVERARDISTWLDVWPFEIPEYDGGEKWVIYDLQAKRPWLDPFEERYRPVTPASSPASVSSK